MRVKVKPAPGLIVLDENNVRIPEDGKEINVTTFYSRLIKEGGLLVVRPQKAGKKEVADGRTE